MSLQYLKKAQKGPGAVNQEARDVASHMLADIEARRELAVREYAARLDHWTGDILDKATNKELMADVFVQCCMKRRADNGSEDAGVRKSG